MQRLDRALEALEASPEGEVQVDIAQEAAETALGTFISAAAAADPAELGALAQRIFLSLPETPAPEARAYILALDFVARAAQRLFERTAPRAEALRELNKQQHLAALQTLAEKERIQANNLREILGIENQSNLARLMRKLGAAGLIAVSRADDNSAWYSLTFEGKRLAKELRAARAARPPQREELETASGALAATLQSMLATTFEDKIAALESAEAPLLKAAATLESKLDLLSENLTLLRLLWGHSKPAKTNTMAGVRLENLLQWKDLEEYYSSRKGGESKKEKLGIAKESSLPQLLSRSIAQHARPFRPA